MVVFQCAGPSRAQLVNVANCLMLNKLHFDNDPPHLLPPYSRSTHHRVEGRGWGHYWEYPHCQHCHTNTFVSTLSLLTLPNTILETLTLVTKDNKTAPQNHKAFLTFVISSIQDADCRRSFDCFCMMQQNFLIINVE